MTPMTTRACPTGSAVVPPRRRASTRVAFDALHDDLWTWGRRHDPLVARRRTEAVPRAARVVIVAEAYAKTTVRVTGVNWFDATGALGNAGHALERMLHGAGCTLAPPRPVALPGAVIPAAAPGLDAVYTTDIFPSYPTVRRHPTSAEIADAMAAGFLARELALVRPTVILLLGTIAYTTFHRVLLGTPPRVSLTTAFHTLTPRTRHPRYQDAVVLPWLHPSGASAAYAAWQAATTRPMAQRPQIRALAAALADGPRTPR